MLFSDLNNNKEEEYNSQLDHLVIEDEFDDIFFSDDEIVKSQSDGNISEEETFVEKPDQKENDSNKTDVAYTDEICGVFPVISKEVSAGSVQSQEAPSPFIETPQATPLEPLHDAENTPVYQNTDRIVEAHPDSGHVREDPIKEAVYTSAESPISEIKQRIEDTGHTISHLGADPGIGDEFKEFRREINRKYRNNELKHEDIEKYLNYIEDAIKSAGLDRRLSEMEIKMRTAESVRDFSKCFIELKTIHRDALMAADANNN